MTRVEAQAYWHDTHGALVRQRGSRTGYRQLHANGPASEELARQIGFSTADYDGAVITYVHSLDALIDTFSSNYVQGPAIEDEMLFIDHRKSTLQAMEILRPRQPV